MDSNAAVLIVLICYWLVADRRISLCFAIACYYALFLVTDITELDGYFSADVDSTLGTYCVQMSVDSLMLVCIVVLSMFYQKSVMIYLLYGAIIATSFLLNGLMLYDQVLDLSIIYRLHAIRQEFSIPLDVLFAVLGSVHNARQNNVDYLRTGYSSIYNRANSYFKTLGG